MLNQKLMTIYLIVFLGLHTCVLVSFIVLRVRRDLLHNLINAATKYVQKKSSSRKFIKADDLIVGSEIYWWFRNILPLESGLTGMVPKNPATRARINRNGSHSSGSEISCDRVSKNSWVYLA